MPRTAIPVTTVTRDGVLDIDVTGNRILSVPADDHTVANNGRTFLYVKNTSAGSLTVTVPAKDGVSDNIVATVLTGDHVILGPFHRSKYNVPQTSTMWVDVNGVNDDLALAAYRY